MKRRVKTSVSADKTAYIVDYFVRVVSDVTESPAEVNQQRLAYRKLGTMMVTEGRLPEVDLIFFLTTMCLHFIAVTRSQTTRRELFYTIYYRYFNFTIIAQFVETL